MTREDASDLLTFLRDDDEQRLPAEKMARIRRIMRMVAPYAQRLPGTKAVMEQEKTRCAALSIHLSHVMLVIGDGLSHMRNPIYTRPFCLTTWLHLLLPLIIMT